MIYCGVCTLPPEYCEFGGAYSKCKRWLEAEHPADYLKLYGSAAPVDEISSLSLEKQQEIEKKVEKQKLKEAARAERDLAKTLSSKIIVKKVDRTRRKQTTIIQGIPPSIDIKKLAKQFAAKLATGASVSKNAEDKDEIVIQGDVVDDVIKVLKATLEKEGMSSMTIERVEGKRLA